MKFIKLLTEAEQVTLEEARKYHSFHRTRSRAHALLLSHKSYTISQLTDIFSVGRDTVSNWLNDWERDGIVSLFDEHRSGRPMRLSEDEQATFRQYVDEAPHQLKAVITRLEQETGKSAHPHTYKRILKKVTTASSAAAVRSNRCAMKPTSGRSSKFSPN